MERHIVFSENETYHVYNRGVEKREIFIDPADYDRMSLLFYLCNSSTPVNIREYLMRGFSYESLRVLDIASPIVQIGAWCLMPNHFHLLLREVKEGGISQFMLKLTTAYSMYFNQKYKRVGSLMQGPFKAEHVQDDRYLQYLFSYIHLNPVSLIAGEGNWKTHGIKYEKGAKNFLSEYKHSSLADYMSPSSRCQSRIIRPEQFPWKFESIDQLNKELADWLTICKG